MMVPGLAGCSSQSTALSCPACSRSSSVDSSAGGLSCQGGPARRQTEKEFNPFHGVPSPAREGTSRRNGPVAPRRAAPCSMSAAVGPVVADPLVAKPFNAGARSIAIGASAASSDWSAAVTAAPSSQQSESRGNSKETKEETIRVAVRFRPSTPHERENSGTSWRAFSICPNRRTVESFDRSHIFEFDTTFDEDASQVDVYAGVAQPLVDDLLDGYNATVLTYGQTGSGKTYCMFGPNPHVETRGVVYRAAQQVFDCIYSGASDVEYVLRCSLFEVYREQLRDLLRTSGSTLKVKETPSQGVFISGLVQESVTCEDDITRLLRLGSRMRAVAATQLNQHSSRSHVIVSLTCEQRRPDGSERVGKLQLTDLAGSEKVWKSSSSGVTLEEAKKINWSLSALGNVIMALAEKRPHIPYRDSKLTRILQETLGGNSKTSLIATCSSLSTHYEETLSTLSFAARAKTVSNRVRVNVVYGNERLELTVARLQQELLQAKREIARHVGQSARSGNRLQWEATMLDSMGAGTDSEDSSWCSRSGFASSASDKESAEDEVYQGARKERVEEMRLWLQQDRPNSLEMLALQYAIFMERLLEYEDDVQATLRERGAAVRAQTGPMWRSLRKTQRRYRGDAKLELKCLMEQGSPLAGEAQLTGIEPPCARKLDNLNRQRSVDEATLCSSDSVQTVLPTDVANALSKPPAAVARRAASSAVEVVSLADVHDDAGVAPMTAGLPPMASIASSSTTVVAVPRMPSTGELSAAAREAPTAEVVPTTSLATLSAPVQCPGSSSVKRQSSKSSASDRSARSVDEGQRRAKLRARMDMLRVDRRREEEKWQAKLRRQQEEFENAVHELKRLQTQAASPSESLLRHLRRLPERRRHTLQTERWLEREAREQRRTDEAQLVELRRSVHLQRQCKENKMPISDYDPRRALAERRDAGACLKAAIECLATGRASPADRTV